MTELLAGPWIRSEHSTVIRVTSPEQPHHAFAMLYLKTGGRGGKPCPRMRATALTMLAAPDLLASLRAILPYAESRAEDMLESDGEADGCDPSDETRKAVAAVDAAKALLASLEG